MISRPRAALAATLVAAMTSCGESGPSRGAGGSGGVGASDPGPDEVLIQSSDGTVYYIDRAEVTRDQYAAWLGTSPSTTPQLSPCFDNDDFTPTCRWPPEGEGDQPVVCVDWCDAYAYCHDNGKRLCGKIGGGANDYHDYADPTLDQWYNACSAQGSHEYPYGSPFAPHACNGALHGRGTTAPVGSMPACRTDRGLVDMSGNVREWKDACEMDTTSVAFNYCRLGGGSFRDGELRHLTCVSPGQDAFRTGHWDSIGFRCCRDAPNTSAGSGGQGGSGGNGAAADPCNECLATSCTAEDAACLSNEECIGMADCEASCFTQECRAECEAAHGAGVVDFQALEACFEAQCAATCP